MGKSYHLGKKSDMQRFLRDFESEIIDAAKEEVSKEKFDVTCPPCNAKIRIPAGRSHCPKCREQITLNLEFDF